MLRLLGTSDLRIQLLPGHADFLLKVAFPRFNHLHEWTLHSSSCPGKKELGSTQLLSQYHTTHPINQQILLSYLHIHPQTVSHCCHCLHCYGRCLMWPLILLLPLPLQCIVLRIASGILIKYKPSNNGVSLLKYLLDSKLYM